MRFVRKILGAVLLAAGVVFVRGRRRARAMARGADAKLDDLFGTSTRSGDDSLAEVATRSGIADVDPEPLSHVAGEGIDPVRDTRAHEELRELHDRMPRH